MTETEMLSDKQLEEIRFDIKNTKPSSSLQGMFRQHCEDLLAENAALREQLAQVEKERDAMRAACVEEVKKVVKGWQCDALESWDSRPDLSFEASDKISGANEIITALESLTLDQVEQEKR